MRACGTRGSGPGGGGARSASVQRDRGRGLAVGVVRELDGGDRADRQHGDDQHDVAQDHGVQAGPGQAVLPGPGNPPPSASAARPPLISRFLVSSWPSCTQQ